MYSVVVGKLLYLSEHLLRNQNIIHHIFQIQFFAHVSKFVHTT